jgi:hypothetical protein
MASINWPHPEIPILQDGYSYNPADNTVRFEPDVGPAQVRRRSTSNPDYLSFKMQMTRSEAEDFYDFYKYATVGGTRRFNFTNPQTLEAGEARFKAPPMMVSKDLDAVVSFELEIL